MRYKDIDISVQVDGKSLPEYAVTTDDAERTMTCWIPSEEGKEFVIMRRNRSKVHEVSMKTCLDGRQMPSDSHFRRRSSRKMYGQRASEDSILPFKFASIKLTEEEGHVSSHKLDLDALGTIEIRVLRTEGKGKYATPIPIQDLAEDFGPVNERSKKAGAHCVAFGDKKKSGKPKELVRHKYLDRVDKPYCKLRFRYRSRDMLLAQGIMADPAPLLPTASGSKKRSHVAEVDTADAAGTSNKKARLNPKSDSVAVKEDPEALDDEDSVELQLESMEANLAVMRARLDQAKLKAVKREPSPIRMVSSGDVIDLTSD
ncbi:hypothetical protein PsYK624_110430 [Phanerochaete sordida]|uniref:DUF7918 domain-containing protein n=1 Tax=Phanerochaete sordida TaxID=48140 RepID=A0A9P3GFT9_9APHY|nr:hypothetical protein PsYK624_110430 [Phanerochaete sordida]